MLCFINGLIITPKTILKDHVVLIENGIIKDILHESSLSGLCFDRFDCKGQYIMPGLIDIHTDLIEDLISPRKGVFFNTETALFEIDKHLIGNGITTVYHSLSLADSTVYGKPMDLPLKKAMAVASDIKEYSNRLLVNHRYHARLEMNATSAYDDVIAMLNNKLIHELSFMDHAPGRGQYSDLAVYNRKLVKHYGNISKDEIDKITQKQKKKKLLSGSQIKTLAKTARDQGVAIAYHDVETTGQLDWLKSIEAGICEFPLNETVAAAAYTGGFSVVVGAPNVLLNRSHTNKLSAKLLLSGGMANVICSDYYSPSLLRAVFTLVQRDNIPLETAVAWATIHPARAVEIDRSYGSIECGKIADLITVDLIASAPLVTNVFVRGAHKLSVNYG